jgi:hypothetical protein
VQCLKVRGHFVDLGIDRKATLKFTLMKDGVRYMRNRSTLDIGVSGHIGIV